MNRMKLLFVNSARIFQFRHSAFVFQFDEGKNAQYEILQFCIKMGSAFVEKASLYVKVRELRFWYLLLIADMFITSRGCKCNESILFLGVLFCRLGRLGYFDSPCRSRRFTENCGLLPNTMRKVVINQTLDLYFLNRKNLFSDFFKVILFNLTQS